MMSEAAISASVVLASMRMAPWAWLVGAPPSEGPRRHVTTSAAPLEHGELEPLVLAQVRGFFVRLGRGDGEGVHDLASIAARIRSGVIGRSRTRRPMGVENAHAPAPLGAANG